ncbi:VWA domain-containing protein [Candidatus Dependentiae bacterium]|nr:VWA domain-containing protein [Candidatus Dependentiae bacterium]
MIKFLGIYFAGINKLFLLPVFLFIIFFIIKNYLNNKKLIKKIVHKNNKKYIYKFFSDKKYLLKTILQIVALIFIFISLLQPQWNKKEINVQQEGRDLLIALDISRSMLAQDLKPNRLEFTKLKIRNLLKKLDFERVGLILFSGSAFLQCPLTSDHNAFLMFLDQVDPETISSGTTAIDNAILKSIEVFSQSRGRKNKLLLLATDGEDFSLNLDHVRNKAEKENIKVFALGIGTKQGAPIPKIDSQGNQIGHELDENGNIAISKLNSDSLYKITKTLSGKFFRFTYDNSDLDSIKRVIQAFEKEKFQDKKMSLYQDQYPWFLAISFLCLALEWIL